MYDAWIQENVNIPCLYTLYFFFIVSWINIWITINTESVFRFPSLFFWDTPGKFMIHIIHQYHFKVNECRYERTVKIGYWFHTDQYCIDTVSSPVPIHTRYCPVLYLYWVVMDCTIFVSDLYCIPDDDTKKVLLSTVFLQLVSSSTVFISAFYCIPKASWATVPLLRYAPLTWQSGIECQLSPWNIFVN